MNKKCQNCGADLPENASFCPHCAQSQIEKQKVKPPRLWRKKALVAALGVLVLGMAALAVFLPNRPKIYEGGASVTYTDKDGIYELLVSTSSNDLENKQPEEKRTLSLSVDETSCLPALLGVYQNGTPVDPAAFLAKVERCTLEAFPNENGALDIAEPRYDEMFIASVLETDVFFNGASGTNELVWTLTMKNGDTIRLKHTFEVLPLVHQAFTAEDIPLNTIHYLLVKADWWYAIDDDNVDDNILIIVNYDTGEVLDQFMADESWLEDTESVNYWNYMMLNGALCGSGYDGGVIVTDSETRTELPESEIAKINEAIQE